MLWIKVFSRLVILDRYVEVLNLNFECSTVFLYKISRKDAKAPSL
jgi:hypothetical protein